jgi:hypothetical protein
MGMLAFLEEDYTKVRPLLFSFSFLLNVRVEDKI